MSRRFLIGPTPAIPQVEARPAPLSWLSLITVWFVWGSTFLAIRVAVQSIPPFLMAGSRYAIAGTFLVLILWVAGRGKLSPITWRDMRSVVVSAVLLLVMGNGLVSHAEVRLQSGTAALIVATVPIWMLILDALIARRLRAVALVGIVLGTLGIVALVGAPAAHVPLASALEVMAGSATWALGSVLARRGGSKRLDPLFPALEMIVAGLLLCVVAAATGEISALHFDRITPRAIEGFVWLVLLGSIVAYSAYGYAVRTLPTNVVATYAYVNQKVNVILGTLLLGERLTLNIFLGGGAIVAAVIVILVTNRHTSR